jgi:hypothetical protein
MAQITGKVNRGMDKDFVTWKKAIEIKTPVLQSASSGLWGYIRVNDGLDLTSCIHKSELAAKQARSSGLYEFYLGEKRRIAEASEGIY